MLVLSRKNQESVVVVSGSEHEPMLTVTVVEIGNGRVRLGFQADAAIPVYRLEVWERMREHRGPDCPQPDPVAPVA
jgi:carbon storage regulator CsrA